jgi:AraC-like DNA-binding protein
MNTPHIAGKPLVFNYQQEDYKTWVQEFASHINTKQTADKLQYPNELADGFVKAKIIEPGYSYRISNLSLHADVEYRRTPSEKFQLILYFYLLDFEDTAYCKIDDMVLESNEKTYSIALMTTSQTKENIIFKKGTVVKGLSVQVDEEWLLANVKNFTSYRHFTQNKKCAAIDFITAKQRKILTDIFDHSDQSQFPELFIKSRVQRLTEQFLTSIYNRGLTEIPEFTNQKDFQSLLKVENLLLQKYADNFPSIETLAKTALMSESKLKKLFKKAFGIAPYEYYQKNRMHRAKELLCSRKHSVTQVGGILGYQNLSNFSAAFKKEFDCLPSHVQDAV